MVYRIFIIVKSSALDDRTCSFLSHPLRDVVKLQREVMSVETALEQKRMARHNLLLACKIQGLPITLLSGNLNEISEVQVQSPEEYLSLE